MDNERYLVVYPSGKVEFQEIQRENMLDRLHEIIGCSCVEQVRTVVPGLVMIVDESGRIKEPPQEHNEFASRFYYGFLCGADDIVGPAVFANLVPAPPYNELDWAPLWRSQIRIVFAVLGMPIPEDYYD